MHPFPAVIATSRGVTIKCSPWPSTPETGEPLVIYQSEQDGQVYARPVAMFHGVDRASGTGCQPLCAGRQLTRYPLLAG